MAQHGQRPTGEKCGFFGTSDFGSWFRPLCTSRQAPLTVGQFPSETGMKQNGNTWVSTSHGGCGSKERMDVKCSAQGRPCPLSSRSVPWGLGAGEVNRIIPVYPVVTKNDKLATVFLHGTVGHLLGDGQDSK